MSSSLSGSIFNETEIIGANFQEAQLKSVFNNKSNEIDRLNLLISDDISDEELLNMFISQIKSRINKNSDFDIPVDLEFTKEEALEIIDKTCIEDKKIRRRISERSGKSINLKNAVLGTLDENDANKIIEEYKESIKDIPMIKKKTPYHR
jgi:hypothetical protein